MDLWKELEFARVGSSFELDGFNIGLMPLIKDMLTKETGHVSEYYGRGTVKQTADANEPPFSGTVSEKYIKYFADKGGRLLYQNLGGSSNIFIWKASLIDLTVSGNYITVQGFSDDQDFLQQTKDYFDTQWDLSKKAGQIYAITKTHGQLSLSSLGNAGIPLIAENYTAKVMEDYKFVIKDMNSETPSGRITIMRGVAGSGKTTLTRAMLLEVPDAMFVLVPPELIVSLAGPELLPLLISYRGNTTGPIILILEDADKCLVKRDRENMNAIQSLLNLGDGILGSMLDLRIVATTNAQELHLEEALTRPGRLSKMLEVDYLDLFTAQKIFLRLCPNKNLPPKLPPGVGTKASKNFKVTLADVYHMARENGWEPNPRKIKIADKVSDEHDD